ncbi:MAG: RcnB family protein [Sphingomicrobium sp.]
MDRAQPVVEKRQQNVRVREQRQDVRQQNLGVREQVRDRRATNVNERGRPTLDQRQQARDQRQESRAQMREQRVDSRERYVQRITQPQRVRPPANARPDQPAPPPQTATNHRAPTWSPTHWRSDRRYDWRNYRDRNRSHFRVGLYFDPFGWNYRRYDVEWRLWPSYYSSNYWLNDPFMYRLPYAPWPYKWVRYYDDALLVNVYTGQVADVIYDFFW